MDKQLVPSNTTEKIDTDILSDEYKAMIDQMLLEDDSGEAIYVSYQNIKDKFLRTS